MGGLVKSVALYDLLVAIATDMVIKLIVISLDKMLSLSHHMEFFNDFYTHTGAFGYEKSNAAIYLIEKLKFISVNYT